MEQRDGGRVARKGRDGTETSPATSEGWHVHEYRVFSGQCHFGIVSVATKLDYGIVRRFFSASFCTINKSFTSYGSIGCASSSFLTQGHFKLGKQLPDRCHNGETQGTRRKVVQVAKGFERVLHKEHLGCLEFPG